MGTQDTCSENGAKAKWDPRLTKMFIRLCAVETNNGNHPGPHLNKQGWANVIFKFQQETGYKYTKNQMKNKWDAMKKEWGIWTKLVQNEIGLGWDQTLGTIITSPEWWQRKLRITPQAAKFRHKVPMLVYEQETLFSDWLLMGLGHGHLIVGSYLNTCKMRLMSKCMIPRLVEMVLKRNMLNLERMLNSCVLLHNLKREVILLLKEQSVELVHIPPRMQAKRSKKLTTAQQVVKCLESMSAKIYSMNPNEKGDNLDECLKIINNFPWIKEGDRLWMYATHLFLKPSIRNLFMKLKKDNIRLLWLHEQHERDTFKRATSPSTSAFAGSRGMSSENYFASS